MPEDGTGVPIEHAESGAEEPVPQTPKNIMEMPADQMQQSAVPGSGTQQNTVSHEPVQQELTYEERIQKALSMPD